MKISRFISVFCMILIAFILACQMQNSGGINPLANFDAMWDYDNPAETEELFRGVLNGLGNSSESSYDRNYHVELLTQIARAQGLQQKFSDAKKTLAEAEKLLNEETKSGKIRYLLELGRIYLSSGEKDKAKEIFLQAYDYGKANKLDFYVMDTIHMLGIVEDPKEQINWNLKAIEIAEETKDLRIKSWLGPLYNNIGWSYHDQGDFEEALKYFQKGYDYRKAQADDNATRIAKWSVGRVYRSLGKYDEALKIQKELEKEIDDANLPKDGYVYQELAELYHIQKNAEAKKYFKLAYDFLSQDNQIVENQSEELDRMKKLSK